VSREPAARPHRTARLAAAAAIGLVLVLGAVAAAPRGLRAPRDRDAITKMLAAGPHAGDCEQCHTTHGDDQSTVYPNALTSPDDNSLCDRCHASAWAGGSFGGDVLYRGTSHGASTRMIWPGPEPPMRVEIDAATKCLNCHDAHGWADALGEIPMLGLQREEKLCLTCHDGSPASTDIASDLRKPYRHPVTDLAGRHSGPGESDPSSFGITPLNQRHAECADCHNAHVSRADGGAPRGNDASLTTLGVSRVAVANGPAGTRPLYTFIAGSDTLTTPNAEYQLCFKCHSSWTTQPAGQTDFGRDLNPANPSFHPVEDHGRNPAIPSLAFAPGWSANSTTRCGDCHGSDFGSAAGPHGSTNAFLLRQPYTRTSDSRQMDPDEICFSCHSYDTYANPFAPASIRAASRFNAPGVKAGHAEHVTRERVPCFACHVTHGSTTQPYLLVTGRIPGLAAYTSTSLGGTCSPTCHGSESYHVNYSR
jgi:predicted CXXCH cytochrome family protein